MMKCCMGSSWRSLLSYFLDWEVIISVVFPDPLFLQVMLVGPEVASRLRRHAAELSDAIGRSASSSDEAGDLQEVISTRGMMSLRTPYWSVSL